MRVATDRHSVGRIAGIALLALAAASDAVAQYHQPLERAGRWMGYGWGDGYHACYTDGVRLGDDLPPRSIAKRRPGRDCNLSQRLARTFYDRFDAANRAAGPVLGPSGLATSGCSGRACDIPRCDQFPSEPVAVPPGQTIAPQTRAVSPATPAETSPASPIPDAPAIESLPAPNDVPPAPQRPGHSASPRQLESSTPATPKPRGLQSPSVPRTRDLVRPRPIRPAPPVTPPSLSSESSGLVFPLSSIAPESVAPERTGEDFDSPEPAGSQLSFPEKTVEPPGLRTKPGRRGFPFLKKKKYPVVVETGRSQTTAQPPRFPAIQPLPTIQRLPANQRLTSPPGSTTPRSGFVLPPQIRLPTGAEPEVREPDSGPGLLPPMQFEPRPATPEVPPSELPQQQVRSAPTRHLPTYARYADPDLVPEVPPQAPVRLGQTSDKRR